MKTLSNPVVFFTLGSCNDFPNHVSGAGYIKVPQNFDEDFIKTEVKRVWQEFLGVYKADILRANFFINADDTALNLPELIIAAEKYFSPLYPAGILGDVYCLFDDSNLIENTRAAALEMLNEIKGDGLNIYLLSNLTSIASFVSKETIAQTVALLTLFKNSSPSLSVAEADASRYNELFFLKNCAARNGDFLTAGSVSLKVPQDALKSLLMAEILKYDGTVSQPAPLKAPAFPQKKPLKTMEYLYGMAIPDVSYSDTLTRDRWIKCFFGQKLDSLDNDWAEADFEDENPIPKATSIYDILRNTSEGGLYEKAARENTENAIAALQAEEEKCAYWLAKPPEKTEYGTRRLSPLKSQELLPYNLAHEYLRKQNDIHHIKEKIKILERQQRQIAKYHKKLKRYETEIKKTITEHEKKSEEINEMFKGFLSDNTTSYFREKFQAYAEAHEPEIAALQKEMLEAFEKNEFSKFKIRLSDFIEKSILPSREFNLPIMEILQELIGDSLPEALSEWVAQNNHLGIRLKTGYAKLHTEANLCIPSSQAFETKKCYEQRGLGRMNLFASENQISVLYHAGAFNLDELYW
ncbi:MAG: hypothetical protein FWB80_09520 [Defluviitaleaceae bacterium]|nr:hypothetical protein [Defluviitaleaceae bacterium]